MDALYHFRGYTLEDNKDCFRDYIFWTFAVNLNLDFVTLSQRRIARCSDLLFKKIM